MLFSSHELILVFLLLGLAGYFALRLFARKSAVLFWLIGASSIFYVVQDGPVLANQSEASPGSESMIMSPMLDAITQNTPGYSEGYPVGVPKTYAWCSGSYKPPGSSKPPSDFTAVTGWGQVYQKAGAPAYSNPNAAVEVANAKTYVHVQSTGQWVLVQDQATDPIAGGHFVSDFSGNAAIDMNVNALSNGSAAFDTPPTGYNDHFWPSSRGTFAAGTVDAAYVQMDMRVNDPNLQLVANIGADWWRNDSAGYVDGFDNNPGAGMSNWVGLSTQWSTLRFYSWSTSQLRAAPPPPLAASSLEAESAFTRRRANTSSPCLSRPHVRLP
jgi:hypothetical protein